MTAAECLIKESKNSSYGALSKAGIEYSTYLSYQHNQDQTCPDRNANLTSQHDDLTSSSSSSSRRRPHSVYAGLSYVPFNYCDDLKIEDIFRHFKQKQELKKQELKRRQRKARRGGTNLPLVRTISGGLDDPFDYDLDDYKRSARYSSCDGLTKSPKVPQRISFTGNTTSSTDASTLDNERYHFPDRQYDTDKNVDGEGEEKPALKGILKVKGSPFNNVRRTVQDDRNDDEANEWATTSTVRNKSDRSDKVRCLNEELVRGKMEERKDSYVYYDDDLQEWLQLNNGKNTSTRLSVSTDSSPLSIRRRIPGGTGSPRFHMKIRGSEQKYRATMQRSNNDDGEDEIRLKVDNNNNINSISLTVEAIERYANGEGMGRNEEREDEDQKEGNGKDRRDGNNEKDSREGQNNNNHEDNENTEGGGNNSENGGGDENKNNDDKHDDDDDDKDDDGENDDDDKDDENEEAKCKAEEQNIIKDNKHNKNVKSYLASYLKKRGVALGAMLSNGQIAETILYELKNNVWLHHNRKNTRSNLNLDDDIDSLLNTHAGTVVCLSLPKAKLIF